MLIRHRKRRYVHWVDRTRKGNYVDVYQPLFLSFSNLRVFGVGLSHFFKEKAVKRTFRQILQKPDVIYCHFWHMGIIGAKIGEMSDLPCFVASGEAEITVLREYRIRSLTRFLPRILGVICVSVKNMEESLRLSLTSKEKTVVIPNSVDTNIFFERDKASIRKELGIGSRDFVVAFTGGFIERKGVEAISST